MLATKYVAQEDGVEGGRRLIIPLMCPQKNLGTQDDVT